MRWDPHDPCDDQTESVPVVGSTQRLITLALVAGPAVGLVLAITLLWSHAVNVSDLLMGTIFYLLTGFGLTIGFHRLFTHKSFKSRRFLKIGLAVLGSMAIEGSVTSWVATHRRHHLYSDEAGDPHSPHRYGGHGFALVRGLFFSHVGWLFISDASNVRRYAPDLLKDRDLQRIARLFPVFALSSLLLPFAIGSLLGRSLIAGVMALVWAGLIRMAILHHVTWSVNSVCHAFGRRSDETPDRSRNVWVLAALSLGESWHNIHHAHPTWARHGARSGMIDPSARVIRLFEQMRWVTRVRWPREQLARAAS